MTQTQQPAAASRTAVRAARSTPSAGHWVALVLVLAGLFGMHGLAEHGSHAAERGTGDAMMMSSAGPMDVAVSLPSAVVEEMSGAAMSLDGMSMLCLAVLTAGALLLVLLRGTRLRQVALGRRPAPPQSAFLAAGRDRDPPSLTALSIRRC
jgi:hypothetical protein